MTRPYPKNRKSREYPSAAERLENGSMPVPFSGCQIWLGHTNKKGYGRLSIQNHLVLAHRLAWEIYRGPIPDGLLVLHECDVPCCINPEHLFLGTNDENMADMARKGRARCSKGTLNPNVKLSEYDVYNIRASKVQSSLLAAIYDVDRHTIAVIRSNKSWRHL